jgi:1-acyl-sn-glycerol-3-phosphate acyltransferase
MIFAAYLNLIFRIQIYGKKNLPEAPYIIVSNHSSIADPPLVGISCSRHSIDFMAKKEVFDTPILGSWAKNVGCISVKRGENSVQSLKEAIRRLKNGRVVGVFPEGTRSLDGKLQEAKRGVGFLIAKAKVPIVPVYIKGSNKAAPKGGKIKYGTNVSVFIGKPIKVEEYESIVQDKDYERIVKFVMKNLSELSEMETPDPS